MSSSKEFRDFILDQLRDLPNISFKPMMGEFLLYCDNILFGGIYDDRLLIKITPTNAEFSMREERPYDGANPMYLVDDIDNEETVAKIIQATLKGL